MKVILWLPRVRLVVENPATVSRSPPGKVGRQLVHPLAHLIVGQPPLAFNYRDSRAMVLTGQDQEFVDVHGLRVV